MHESSQRKQWATDFKFNQQYESSRKKKQKHPPKIKKAFD